MKKIVLTLFLILTMCISLCACNADMDSGFQANSSIMQIQGERISESDMPEEKSNSITNDKQSKSDAEITLKEDFLQEKVDSIGDIGSGEAYWVSGSSVNFRRSPSTKGEIITQLKKGTEIIKMAEDGEWAYIRCGETTGYVHMDYLSSYQPVMVAEGEVSIIVKKSERLLELWQDEVLLGSYSIGLGWEPEGHKQVEGDGKTPEGEYYVCVRNSNSSFYLSLGVSYPNKEDAAAALEDGRIDNATYKRIANAIEKGQCPDWYTTLGGEIMIHGCGGSTDWTAGCVAVDNEVMDILFECCPLGTKITILP